MQLAARERWIDRWRFVRFATHLKPWDYTARGPKRLGRFFRMLTQGFRPARVAGAQKIPELQQSPRGK